MCVCVCVMGRDGWGGGGGGGVQGCWAGRGRGGGITGGNFLCYFLSGILLLLIHRFILLVDCYLSYVCIVTFHNMFHLKLQISDRNVCCQAN